VLQSCEGCDEIKECRPNHGFRRGEHLRGHYRGNRISGVVESVYEIENQGYGNDRDDRQSAIDLDECSITLDSYAFNRKQKYFNKSQAASSSWMMLLMDASAL
jgi:hypothetical protein